MLFYDNLFNVDNCSLFQLVDCFKNITCIIEELFGH